MYQGIKCATNAFLHENVEVEVFNKKIICCQNLNSTARQSYWKHCNACVFEDAGPCISEVLQAMENESNLWCMAGASALHELLIRLLNLDT